MPVFNTFLCSLYKVGKYILYSLYALLVPSQLYYKPYLSIDSLFTRHIDIKNAFEIHIKILNNESYHRKSQPV